MPMSLPDADVAHLQGRGISHTVTTESNMTCVVISGWPLPPGFNVESADLLIRLSPGYPDVHPDMWWFAPAVYLANGTKLNATEVSEPHLGRTWQRWSRHLQKGQWQSGVDGLESYMALIRRDLEGSVAGPGK